MKIGFVIPILNDYACEKQYNAIAKACHSLKVGFEVLFAINGKLDNIFTDIRTKFIETENVKAIKTDTEVNQHKLITLGMKYSEDNDAVIVYSGKNEIDGDIIKSFITSWKAGNKIVYLKKEYSGFKKFCHKIKYFFYQLGIKILQIFNDNCAENDIQLFDAEVVKTINQLPAKNRQLRVLDSFVGYKRDVVLQVETTSVKPDVLYVDKSKTYYASVIIMWSLAVLTVASFVVELLALIMAWQIGGLTHLLLWLLVGIFGLGIIIFYTRSVLSLRVGEQLDSFEIKCLIDKLEKYNVKAN